MSAAISDMDPPRSGSRRRRAGSSSTSSKAPPFTPTQGSNELGQSSSNEVLKSLIQSSTASSSAKVPQPKRVEFPSNTVTSHASMINSPFSSDTHIASPFGSNITSSFSLSTHTTAQSPSTSSQIKKKSSKSNNENTVVAHGSDSEEKHSLILSPEHANVNRSTSNRKQKKSEEKSEVDEKKIISPVPMSSSSQPLSSKPPPKVSSAQKRTQTTIPSSALSPAPQSAENSSNSKQQENELPLFEKLYPSGRVEWEASLQHCLSQLRVLASTAPQFSAAASASESAESSNGTPVKNPAITLHQLLDHAVMVETQFSKAHSDFPSFDSALASSTTTLNSSSSQLELIVSRFIQHILPSVSTQSVSQHDSIHGFSELIQSELVSPIRNWLSSLSTVQKLSSARKHHSKRNSLAPHASSDPSSSISSLSQLSESISVASDICSTSKVLSLNSLRTLHHSVLFQLVESAQKWLPDVSTSLPAELSRTLRHQFFPPRVDLKLDVIGQHDDLPRIELHVQVVERLPPLTVSASTSASVSISSSSTPTPDLHDDPASWWQRRAQEEKRLIELSAQHVDTMARQVLLLQQRIEEASHFSEFGIASSSSHAVSSVESHLSIDALFAEWREKLTQQHQEAIKRAENEHSITESQYERQWKSFADPWRQESLDYQEFLRQDSIQRSAHLAALESLIKAELQRQSDFIKRSHQHHNLVNSGGANYHAFSVWHARRTSAEKSVDSVVSQYESTIQMIDSIKSSLIDSLSSLQPQQAEVVKRLSGHRQLLLHHTADALVFHYTLHRTRLADARAQLAAVQSELNEAQQRLARAELAHRARAVQAAVEDVNRLKAEMAEIEATQIAPAAAQLIGFDESSSNSSNILSSPASALPVGALGQLMRTILAELGRDHPRAEVDAKLEQITQERAKQLAQFDSE